MSEHFKLFVKQFKKCNIEHLPMILKAYGYDTYTAYHASIGTKYQLYITYWMQYFRVEAIAKGVPTWKMNYSSCKHNSRDFVEIFKNQFSNYLNNDNNEEFMEDFKEFVMVTQNQGNYKLIEKQVLDIMKGLSTVIKL